MHLVRKIEGQNKSCVPVNTVGVLLKMIGRGHLRCGIVKWRCDVQTAVQLTDFEFLTKEEEENDYGD